MTDSIILMQHQRHALTKIPMARLIKKYMICMKYWKNHALLPLLKAELERRDYGKFKN